MVSLSAKVLCGPTQNYAIEKSLNVHAIAKSSQQNSMQLKPQGGCENDLLITYLIDII